MVTDVYEQWIGDDEGELVMTLHGLQKGAEITAYFDEGVYKDDIEEGDLIRYATNSSAVPVIFQSTVFSLWS